MKNKIARKVTCPDFDEDCLDMTQEQVQACSEYDPNQSSDNCMMKTLPTGKL